MSGIIASGLDDFLSVLSDRMAQALRNDSQRAAYRRVFDDLPRGSKGSDAPLPQRQPACSYLGDCYDYLEVVGMSDIASRFCEIEPALHWYNHTERRVSDHLAERYAEAMILGPGGVVSSDAVEIGVSVMAPQTTYPNHRHPPEELYLALSEGQWRQEEGAWINPGLGGLIHNPANIVHAMRSDERPFLAIWCLPLR